MAAVNCFIRSGTGAEPVPGLVSVDAHCRVQGTCREKRGIALIANERNDAFRAQSQQRSGVTTRQRPRSSEEFAGGSKVASWVGGKVEQRRLINPDVHKIAACVVGASVHRMMPNRLYELFELSIRVGMVGDTGRRTQAIKTHLAGCGAT